MRDHLISIQSSVWLGKITENIMSVICTLWLTFLDSINPRSLILMQKLQHTHTQIGIFFSFCCFVFLCAGSKRPLSWAVVLRQIRHGWEWDRDGRSVNRGVRQTGFSQADNFVLGQETWHHDGWRWRCGCKGQETLSPTVAPGEVEGTWTHKNTLVDHTVTPLQYTWTTVPSPVSTNIHTGIHTSDMTTEVVVI